jgi:CBS domain-containing protein
MQTAADILDAKGYDVWSVGPDATVLEALKVMADKEVGAVLVQDGGGLLGILSERDYARKVVLAGRSSREAPVSEVMTRNVVCVTPDRSVEDCMAMMTDNRLRHLPVLDADRVIGVISIGDLVKAVIDDREVTIAYLQSYIAG